MIILNLFGTTTGLELVQIPLYQAPSIIKFENSWIEITERQIINVDGADSYVVFRKIVGSTVLTWVGLYRPALEFGGNRSGSFYGAGAWMIDCVVDIRELVEILKDLADQINLTAMDGVRFIRRISDTKHEIKVPTRASNLSNSASKISGGCHPSGEIAFIVNNGNAPEIIDWAQRARSAYVYSKLFIGGANQVPVQGAQVAVSVHRSLPLAIEFAYLKLGNELQSLRNELSSKQQNLNEVQQQESKLRQDANYLREYLDGARIELKRAQELNESLRRENGELSRQLIAWSNQSQRFLGSERVNYDVPIISTEFRLPVNNLPRDEISHVEDKEKASVARVEAKKQPDRHRYEPLVTEPQISRRTNGKRFYPLLIGLIFLCLVILAYLAYDRTKNDPRERLHSLPSYGAGDARDGLPQKDSFLSESNDNRIITSQELGSQEFHSYKLIGRAGGGNDKQKR